MTIQQQAAAIIDAAVQQLIAENEEQIRKAWAHMVMYGSYHLHDDGNGKLTAIDPAEIMLPMEGRG
jgi:hypothetical protein